MSTTTYRPGLKTNVLNVWFEATDNSLTWLQRHVLPDYWYEALHYGLAYRLYVDYGIKMDNDPYHNHAKELEKLAKEALKEAKDFDNEDTYIKMEPDEVLNYGGTY